MSSLKSHGGASSPFSSSHQRRHRRNLPAQDCVFSLPTERTDLKFDERIATTATVWKRRAQVKLKKLIES
jgi:hypothetical protein